MAVTVTVQKAGMERWANASGLYPFTAEVTATSGGIPKQVFVMQIQSDGEPVYFDLATSDTLMSIPVVGTATHTPGDFVRKEKAEIGFKTLQEANDFAVDLDRRLAALCSEWDAGNALTTPTTTVVTGSRLPTPTTPSTSRTIALRVLPEFVPTVEPVPVVVAGANVGFEGATNYIETGADPGDLGIGVGWVVSGTFITEGTVVTELLPNGVNIDIGTEDTSDGTDITFTPPVTPETQVIAASQPNDIADYLEDYRSGNETTGHGNNAICEGGWLPVSARPLSWSPAPPGARFFYNTLYADGRFRRRDFPLNPASVSLVLNGIILQRGLIYEVTPETIYWLDFTASAIEAYPKEGNAPWGIDYVDLDDSGDTDLTLLLTT